MNIYNKNRACHACSRFNIIQYNLYVCFCASYSYEYCICMYHRRRIELEEKAKAVASVSGAKCVQFLAALAFFPRSIYKKRMNPTASSNSTEAKQLARQGIEQMLPPKQTRRPLPCLLSVIISFFYDMSSKSSHILYICSAALFATRSEFLCGHSDYFQDSVHTTCELSTSLS